MHEKRAASRAAARHRASTSMTIRSLCWYAMLMVCAASIAASNPVATSKSYADLSRGQVHALVSDLYHSGKFVELEEVAHRILNENPIASTPSKYPSVYEYLGIAQYTLGNLGKAITTFERAVKVNDDDAMSWAHLGNCYMYNLQLAEAIKTLEIAVFKKGATSQMHQLFKARNWIADWRDRDDILAQVAETIRDDVTYGRPTGATALDYVELEAPLIKQMAIIRDHHTPKEVSPRQLPLTLRSSKLRVGFVSSDFGVHPVVTLMRGLLEMLSQDLDQDVTVYCFAITDASSWWKRNITRTVDHMVSLNGKDPAESAAIIHSHGIHVLIDLNGHTLHTGLPIFSHRPAPVQITFLGYPMTTGDPHIDFFISDPVSTPPETADALFTEKLLLLPTHYIVNDHKQMMGHATQGERPPLSVAAPRWIEPEEDVFVFATFSNWQKMDPYVFSAWMAIMKRVPKSILWFLRSKGHKEAEVLLVQEAFGHGIDGEKRLVFSDLQPWLHHTQGKRAADLVLDTTLKNGHTTMLDALWAGVPVVTLEGNRMSGRAGSSALHALRLHELVVNSIKEYVDLAVELATDRGLLRRLRATTEQHRMAYPLFDTPRYTNAFSAALRSAWQVGKFQRQRDPNFQSSSSSSSTGSFRAMHIFSPVQDASTMKPHLIDIHSAVGDDAAYDEYEERVRTTLLSGEHILLHVGGHASKDGWWIVDLDDRDNVDFVLPMDKLYPFPDNSVAAIYASHVLEHVHFGVNQDVRHTLDEWFRALRPGGSVMIAVPDLAVLSSLFINQTISEQDRFTVMLMMYGGQINEYDVHKVGFNWVILKAFLENAGFCEIQRVDDFHLFVDASVMAFHGTPISLNVQARACKPGSDWIHTHVTNDGFRRSTK